jgi:short-subunit dehydrogenase
MLSVELRYLRQFCALAHPTVMSKSQIRPIHCLAAAAAGLLIASSRRQSRLREGQIAVVTGGSRGLGLQLAHRFGRAGLKLVLAAREQSELENARRELLAAGSVATEDDVLLIACDLVRVEEASRLVEAAIQRFGRLDVLINDAGIIEVGPVENQPLEAYHRAMAVNFFAALYTTYAAMPYLLAQRSGSIVNISSIGGKFAVPHLLPYVASKFALTGYSEGLHGELRSKGVRVTTVCPGLMRTGGEVHAHFHGQAEKEKAWFQWSARTPLVSVSAANAARQIFCAVDQGRAELTISPQAWLAARFSGLAPESTQAIAALVNNYLLPSPLSSDVAGQS